jgi:hypothetical protein
MWEEMGNLEHYDTQYQVLIGNLNLIRRYVKRSELNSSRLDEVINNAFINDALG